MNYSQIIIPILEVIALVLPVLLSVAYVTVAERKTMASMQRRLGPNVVGFYGSLQAFADALKLLLKEYIAPSQANIILFFIGPIITLVFSLLAFSVIPFGPGITVFNFNLGILYILAVSSISTYGILLAGWSANSKYAFLGSLRSSAQLISYELILTSIILLIMPLTGSLNLLVNIENQKIVWFILPLFPLFIMFLISSIAETNRAPFDLAEAESELVSGFMTEHSAVIFVFFFLAEYASIVLMCILVSILFLGGYLYEYEYINIFIETVFSAIIVVAQNVHELLIVSTFILHCKLSSLSFYEALMSNELHHTWEYNWLQEYYTSDSIHMSSLGTYYDTFITNICNALSIALKTCLIIFAFIWIRASFPRIRYDQLMSYCWTSLLPIIVGFLVLLPCLVYGQFSLSIIGFLL